MNHGYDARPVIRQSQPLTIGLDVFQENNVPDRYGVPLDRLPNPRLHFRYGPYLTVWYCKSGANNMLRSHPTTDIQVFQSH